MSVKSKFAASAASSPGKTRRKRPAPLSIRLSDEERARLVDEARGTPLSTYIKAKTLKTPPLRLRRSGQSIEDRQAMARAPALLGSSEISTSLNQIAQAVSIGVLPVTPETEAELFKAISSVREVRRLLVHALGLKEGDQ